jgi:hypothetical protein
MRTFSKLAVRMFLEAGDPAWAVRKRLDGPKRGVGLRCRDSLRFGLEAQVVRSGQLACRSQLL